MFEMVAPPTAFIDGLQPLGDVYFRPSLMAATALVAIPLGIAYGPLLD